MQIQYIEVDKDNLNLSKGGELYQNVIVSRTLTDDEFNNISVIEKGKKLYNTFFTLFDVGEHHQIKAINSYDVFYHHNTIYNEGETDSTDYRLNKIESVNQGIKILDISDDKDQKQPDLRGFLTLSWSDRLYDHTDESVSKSISAGERKRFLYGNLEKRILEFKQTDGGKYYDIKTKEVVDRNSEDGVNFNNVFVLERHKDEGNYNKGQDTAYLTISANLLIGSYDG